MEQSLIFSIIDFVVMNGPQIIGIILLIILSKFFIQGILWILSRLVFIFLGLVKILLNFIYVILTLLPGGRFDQTIFKIESTIRSMGNKDNSIKKWFKEAPRKYQKVHRNLVTGIKSLIGLAVAAFAVILVYSIFIAETLTMEQVFNRLEYALKMTGRF